MERDNALYRDLDRILVTREQIHDKVKELGQQIARDYAGKEPVMICILKGASVFFTDLIREVPLQLTTDFMAISSYGSATKTSGVVRILKDLDKDGSARRGLPPDCRPAGQDGAEKGAGSAGRLCML